MSMDHADKRAQRAPRAMNQYQGVIDATDDAGAFCASEAGSSHHQWDRATVRMTPVDQRVAWLRVAVARYAAHTHWMLVDTCPWGSQ